MRSPLLGVAALTCVLASATTAFAADSDDGAVLTAPPLTFRVEPSSKAGSTWRGKITNDGDLPVRVVADPSLLVFELTEATSPDAKKKARETTCELPAADRATSDAGRDLVIPPKKSWSFTFDPLFYCFGKRERSALAKGTVVKPRFGWLPARKATTLRPPFVAEPLDGHEGAMRPTKVLEGRPFVFGEHADPSTTSPSIDAHEPKTADDVAHEEPRKPADVSSAPLVLTMPGSLDASTGRSVASSVTLSNEGKSARATLFRANTIGFRVEGPDGGSTTCGTPRSVAAPIRELFTTLRPKGRTSVSILVSGVCDAETFAMPGIYRVFARLDTTGASGRSIGLRSWDGQLESTTPLTLRVRRAMNPLKLPAPALDP